MEIHSWVVGRCVLHAEYRRTGEKPNVGEELKTLEGLAVTIAACTEKSTLYSSCGGHGIHEDIPPSWSPML